MLEISPAELLSPNPIKATGRNIAAMDGLVLKVNSNPREIIIVATPQTMLYVPKVEMSKKPVAKVPAILPAVPNA